MKKSVISIAVLLLTVSIMSGCAKMVMNSMMEPAVANLQRQTDLDLVCEGASSFLLLIDSMLESDPADKDLLLTATKAFSAYATTLDVCGRPDRAATVSTKARKYGLTLIALYDDLEAIEKMDVEVLRRTIATLSAKDADALFWAGNGWATWIRFQKGSPTALADLVRVELIMQRVIELNETVYHGGAHIFLGAYFGSKPPMLGGQPEKSKAHFEKALQIGKREFLPAQLAYAQIYARMMYDQELYTRLLEEIIIFPLDKRPDIALPNQAAKRQAKELLKEVDRYF